MTDTLTARPRSGPSTPPWCRASPAPRPSPGCPRLEDVGSCDVAVVGVPFDAGVSYRPGARFGPAAVREASRLLRPYHPGLDVEPFATQQVADAGDIACNPFDILEAVAAIEAGADQLLGAGARLVTHRRRPHDRAARCCVRSHAGTARSPCCTSTRTSTPGTPTSAPATPTARRSAARIEEGLLDIDALSHVGIRGPLYGPGRTSIDDARMGFGIVTVDGRDAPGRRRGRRRAARTDRRPAALHLDRHRRASTPRTRPAPARRRPGA